MVTYFPRVVRHASGLALFVLFALSAPVRAQSIALTFDDGLDPTVQPKAAEWNSAILRALHDGNVKSMLFPAGGRVDNPEGLSLVRDWGRAGHAIGNHTYSHRSLNSQETSSEQFIADVEKSDMLLKVLPGWTRRFRFPYLKEGDSRAKRDEVREWLHQHDYRSGVPSVDTSDWYYSQRYVAWLASHPSDDPATFRQAYLDHLWSRARYYDGLSNLLLKRSARYVLLLHTNAINAAFLPDVIRMFRSKGWKIISPRHAYQDRLYSMVPDVVPAGESILWSLAKERGVPNLRYPAEDERYELPILDAAGL
jgi:peptidoglycan/xylan/chitin deacetylase (PgdA/CDA1 family)